MAQTTALMSLDITGIRGNTFANMLALVKV